MSNLFHYLYQGICYIPYALGMVIILLYSPALALFPRLTSSSLFFTAIPLLSIALLNLMGLILFQLNYYDHFIIISLSGILFILAVLRQIHYYRHNQSEWIKEHKYLLILNLGIIFPLIAISGLGAFITDDALISWNFWARLNYANISSGNYSAGYPQYYPFFLSYCYKFLGNTEYQGPVKVLLVIFPFTLLNCLAFSSKHIAESWWRYIIIAFICIFPGFLSLHFYRFYSVGYADPILAANIVLSVLFLLKYIENKNSFFLFISTVSAVAASLSKQPGFLWALWGFPIVLITNCMIERKIKLENIISFCVVIFSVLIWLLGAGKYFTHNTGVLTASMGSANITFQVMLRAFWHSVVKYFILQPTLMFLYVGAYVSLNNRIQKVLFWGYIIPSTILWLIFGAYDVRLGLHNLVLCGLLICINVENIHHNFLLHLKKVSFFVLSVGVLLFLFFSIREQNVIHENVEDHIYPLNASKTIIYRYFSTGGEFIYDNIYLKPQVKLWIPTFYIIPIFYDNNEIIKPVQDYSCQVVLNQIKQTKPDYLFSSGKFKSPASDCLLRLVQQQPKVFTEIPLGNPHYKYRLFKFNETE